MRGAMKMWLLVGETGSNDEKDSKIREATETLGRSASW